MKGVLGAARSDDSESSLRSCGVSAVLVGAVAGEGEVSDSGPAAVAARDTGLDSGIRAKCSSSRSSQSTKSSRSRSRRIDPES